MSKITLFIKFNNIGGVGFILLGVVSVAIDSAVSGCLGIVLLVMDSVREHRVAI